LIAKLHLKDENLWVPGKELNRLIEHAGFSVNAKKTRMQYRDSRQEVTGLIVNKKVNVKSEYRRLVRSMVHHLFTTGHFEHTRYDSDGKGGVAKRFEPGTIDELHGMLGFVDHVDNNNRVAIPIDASNNKVTQKSKEQVYKRFLIYKELYAPARPLIICEGPTDNIYILHSIRSLAAKFPQLAKIDASGKIDLKVRLFKYVETSTGRILGLTGGTGDFGKLMHSYNKEIKKFGPAAIQHPTILLVDNDSGATGKGRPFQAVKEITKKPVNRHDAFTHVVGNLYLVSTPLKAGVPDSMIEDFFDATTLSEIVNGKKFSTDNDADINIFYGKKVFAHKVVKTKADTIDFSDFSHLLRNITLVLDDYYAKHPSVRAVTL
jgi:hypothetical protein